MPSEEYGPPARAWRDKASERGREPEGKYDWQKGKRAKKEKKPWSRRTKLLTAISLLVVVIGGLIGLYIIFLPPTAPYLVLVSEDYATNLKIPHNIYGKRGAEELGDWIRTNQKNDWYGDKLPRLDEENIITNVDKVQEKLQEFGASTFAKNFRKRVWGEPALVMFLSLHGAADSNGREPYLLRDVAAPDKEENRLKLSTVLDWLKDLGSKKKLLILDATQMDADWSLGILRNDFASALKNLEEQILKDENLVVMSASGPGERSWIAETPGKSVFTYFVQKGLEGDADGYVEDKGVYRRASQDEQINALELYNYVRHNVDQWAQWTQSRSQQPVLLPEGEKGRRRAGEIHLSRVVKAASGSSSGKDSSPKEAATDKSSSDKADEKTALAKNEDKKDSPDEKKDKSGQGGSTATGKESTDKSAATETKPDSAGSSRDTAETPQAPWAKALKDAWLAYETLEKTVPSPAVYAPQVWHLYQTTLIRYEQVVLANARIGNTETQEACRELLTRLGQLKESLQAAPREWESAENTLPMRAALGVADTANNRESEEINWLLKKLADSDLSDEEWRRLTEKPGWAMRTRCAEAVLKNAQNNPQEDKLRKLHERLSLVGWNKARPAEVHFLAMLAHLPPGEGKRPPDNLIGQALEVRTLAERAALASTGNRAGHYPYSERIYRWIGKEIEQADNERRPGEDLLFVSGEEAAKEATEHFKKARDQYEKAGEKAAALRAAFEVRDRALAWLPFYTEWVARRGPEARTLVEPLKSLLEHANELDKGLGTPPRSGQSESRELPGRLADRTRKVREELGEIEAAFYGYCSKQIASAERGYSQARSHELRDLLSIPWTAGDNGLGATQRIRLLKIAQYVLTEREREADERIAAQADGAAQSGPGEGGKPSLPDIGISRELTWRLLGPATPQAFNSQDFETNKAGSAPQIAESWKASWMEIDKGTSNGRGVESLVDAEKSFESAERYCRWIDGAWVAGPNPSPVDYNHRLHLHELLLWQAKRTALDQWNSDDSSKKPYYHAAGSLFVKDAQAVLPQAEFPKLAKEARKQVTDRQTLLETPVTLTSEWKGLGKGPATVRMTTQRSAPLHYMLQVTPVEKTVTGYAAIRPPSFGRLTGDTKQMEELLAGQAKVSVGSSNPIEVRLENRADFKPLSTQKEIRLSSRGTENEAKPETIKIEAFYRGFTDSLLASVDFQITPDTVVYQRHVPKDAPCGVAVLTEPREDKAAVSIIMDCSGSMKPQKGQTRGRWHDACDELRTVLKQIPPDTRVSLWVFGEEPNEILPVPKFGNNPTLDSLQRLRDPASWKGADDANQIMNKLDKLKPYYFTPLTRAIWQAQFDFPKNFTGPKIILVLTDGRDEESEELFGARAKAYDYDDRRPYNAWGQDIPWPGVSKDSNSKRPQGQHPDIRTFMKNEINQETTINMVLFRVSDDDRQDVQKDFGCIESFRHPGHIYSAGDELVEALEHGVGLYRYRIYRDKARFAPWDSQHDSAKKLETSDSPNWYWLPPGVYDVGTIIDKQRRELRLRFPAELLLLRFNPEQESFQQAVSADIPPKVTSELREVKEGWELAVYPKPVRPPRRDFLVTLEEKSRATESTLSCSSVRTQDIWLELTAGQDDKQRIGRLLWGNDVGYPAPAWRVESDGVLTYPTLQVWKKKVAPGTPLLRGRIPDTFTRNVNGKEVHIEARVVPYRIYDCFQKAATEQCLVVRITHDEGDRMFASFVRDFPPEEGGYEHQFYKGSYTGVFWYRGASADKLKLRAVDDLQLFTVSSMKKDAIEFHRPLPSRGTSDILRSQLEAMSKFVGKE
jgi:hypothetical protein